MGIKLHKSLSNLETLRRWKAGEATDIKIYNNITEKEKYREEGESWTDYQGIKYKKQDGKVIKLTKTQGDVIREAIDKEFDCDKCGAKYKFAGKLDRKFLLRTGICFDCLVEYETKLRIVGLFDTYEKYKLSSYALGDLKEGKEKLKEIVEYFEKNDGDVVLPSEDGVGNDAVWKNTNKDKILKDAKTDLKKVKKFITQATKVRDNNKKEYIEGCEKFKLEVFD